jgi:DNA (cytosine-5)-methyltransferase 1
MIAILANTYFSGAGLMDIGLQSGGLTLQQSFEIEAVCCDTLRRNFAHKVVQCDITQKLASEKECDVMVATYPCTKYSPIADIHGVRTGEPICFCIAATEPSLTVGLASRRDSQA